MIFLKLILIIKVVGIVFFSERIQDDPTAFEKFNDFLYINPDSSNIDRSKGITLVTYHDGENVGKNNF